MTKFLTEDELRVLPSVSCTCEVCRSMCGFVPCIGTPKDMKRLIDAGHAKRLMLSCYGEDSISPHLFPILKPAIKGRETGNVTRFEGGPCTFFKDERCEIHAIKPTEGRTCDHSQESTKKEEHIHNSIRASWNIPEGLAVVLEWEKMIKE